MPDKVSQGIDAEKWLTSLLSSVTGTQALPMLPKGISINPNYDARTIDVGRIVFGHPPHSELSLD